MTASNRIVLSSDHTAIPIRQHNDANMLSIGARVVGEGLALEIVDAFLAAQFDGGRHVPRVAMIRALEG